MSEELRDKIYQHESDFDQDKMWEQLNPDKRKRRVVPWWWFGGFAMVLLLGTATIFLFGEQSTSVSVQNEVLEESLITETVTNSETANDLILSETKNESNASLSSNTNEKKLSTKVPVEASKSTVARNQNAITKTSKLSSNLINDEVGKINRAVPSKPVQEYKVSQKIPEVYSNYQHTNPIAKNQDSLPFSCSTLNPIGLNTFIVSSRMSTLPSKNVVLNRRSESVTVKTPNTKWSLGLYGNYLNPFDLDRKYESPLGGYEYGITLGRQFQRMGLHIGVSNRTLHDHLMIQENWEVINVLDVPVTEIITSEGSQFLTEQIEQVDTYIYRKSTLNTYQTLFAELGVSYDFIDLSKFQSDILLRYRHGLATDVKGASYIAGAVYDLSSDESSLINHSINNIGIGLGFHYKIGAHISFGISGSYSTDLKSYFKNSTGKHKILGVGSTLSVYF